MWAKVPAPFFSTHDLKVSSICYSEFVIGKDPSQNQWLPNHRISLWGFSNFWNPRLCDRFVIKNSFHRQIEVTLCNITFCIDMTYPSRRCLRRKSTSLAPMKQNQPPSRGQELSVKLRDSLGQQAPSEATRSQHQRAPGGWAQVRGAPCQVLLI